MHANFWKNIQLETATLASYGAFRFCKKTKPKKQKQNKQTTTFVFSPRLPMTREEPGAGTSANSVFVRGGVFSFTSTSLWKVHSAISHPNAVFTKNPLIQENLYKPTVVIHLSGEKRVTLK